MSCLCSEIYFKTPSLQKPTPIRDVKAAQIGIYYLLLDLHLNLLYSDQKPLNIYSYPK